MSFMPQLFILDIYHLFQPLLDWTISRLNTATRTIYFTIIGVITISVTRTTYFSVTKVIPATVTITGMCVIPVTVTITFIGTICLSSS